MTGIQSEGCPHPCSNQYCIYRALNALKQKVSFMAPSKVECSPPDLNREFRLAVFQAVLSLNDDFHHHHAPPDLHPALSTSRPLQLLFVSPHHQHPPPPPLHRRRCRHHHHNHHNHNHPLPAHHDHHHYHYHLHRHLHHFLHDHHHHHHRLSLEPNASDLRYTSRPWTFRHTVRGLLPG